MKALYKKDGYRETISKGLQTLSRLKDRHVSDTKSKDEQIGELKAALEKADAIVIGAGSGLSTSAGFTYSDERFRRYFFDFADAFGIDDIYSGGFYPFPSEEIRWAWWGRHIYFNRYVPATYPVYDDLFSLVKDKNYFVITTNVDHLFQQAGFDKKRLFYTQGDYGLFQRADGKGKKTCDNETWVMKAVEAQGFVKDEKGIYQVPDDGRLSLRLPTELIPRWPDDGSPVAMNLRTDDLFVEDEGWDRVSATYAAFLQKYEGANVLYFELGVGSNTPVIIKYPFWQMTLDNDRAVYVCLNRGEAFCPAALARRSICLNADIGDVLKRLS